MITSSLFTIALLQIIVNCLILLGWPLDTISHRTIADCCNRLEDLQESLQILTTGSFCSVNFWNTLSHITIAYCCSRFEGLHQSSWSITTHTGSNTSLHRVEDLESLQSWFTERTEWNVYLWLKSRIRIFSFWYLVRVKLLSAGPKLHTGHFKKWAANTGNL